MKCPYCNKEIDTSNVSEVNKDSIAEEKKDPFAPSDHFSQMCKPTKQRALK